MNTKYLLITCLLLAVIPQQVFCSDIPNLILYNKWRFSNKRVYLNDEEQVYRQTVFFENFKRISDHNNNKEATYKMGLNQFSDMTNEEFSQRILNQRLSEQNTNPNQPPTSDVPRFANYTLPESVDWRTRGVITPVKNQGLCGSCWTFSAAGVLESFYAITNGVNKLTTFAEQQFLDCVHYYSGYQSSGCNGGFPDHAFHYASRYGVVIGSQYPYTGYVGRCRVTAQTQGYYPKKYTQVGQTVEALKGAIAFAPVSVAIDASNWNSYVSGVYNGCGQYTQYNQLNHAAIAVGYDAQGNWIIKNSFGTTWGENGYMRLAPGNTCGVLYHSYVVIE